MMKFAQVDGLSQWVDVPDSSLNPGWRGGIRQENVCRHCGYYDWAHVNGKHPDAKAGTPCYTENKQ